MINILAHAGETHGSDIAATAHELGWYIQLPLFIILVAVFASTVWLISKKMDTTLLVTAALLLITGFGLFEIAPLVSALAITVGLVTTLGVTLLGLGSEQGSK